MHFINKLIKRTFFSLLLMFSFFVFCEGENIKAQTCSISLNDGNEYLVLNTSSGWTDSGVMVICDGVSETNVSVQINNGTALETSNSGIGIANDAVRNAGFYKIKYYLTSDPSVSITRNIRVLPYNLNDSRRIWLGANEEASSAENDAFNKVIAGSHGYLAVGNLGTKGYIVAFNLRGEYLWQYEIENAKINDIIYSSSKRYYIAGEYTNSTSAVVGFVKLIQLMEQSGIEDEYVTGTISSTTGTIAEISEMTNVKKMVISGNYLLGVGYKEENNVRIGKIVRLTINGNELVSEQIATPTGTINSQYNSLITISDGSISKLVAVGSTNIQNYAGAEGGLITVCSVEAFECTNQDPYLYLNNNGATTTITSFNDIIQYGSNYLVVGQSRIDRVNGSSINYNSGVEDSLYVFMSGEFIIVDIKLSGTSSEDNLLSIKNIEGNSFVAAGNRASAGYYSVITIEESTIQISEYTIAGNLGVEIQDVIVKKEADGEIHYLFVGTTQSNSIEAIVTENKGGQDSLLVIVDTTELANYENLNIVQNTVICNDGSQVCTGENILEEYHLIYGSQKVGFPSTVTLDSTIITQYSTYHRFENALGMTFILGRNVDITEGLIPEDIVIEEMGIDKWYLYSRVQQIGDNVAGATRKELWEEYYYPVENNQLKEPGTTYYILNAEGNFVIDERTNTYTSSNYIKLEGEPQLTTAAFQSIEKAQEFAILQEFARIALVKGKYNYISSGITAFRGETARLSNLNYYFVYYIDLKFSNGECRTLNGELSGNCTQYTGFAFASLSRIKEVATLIVEEYNYFVSESNNRYQGNVSLPSTEYFKEEMTTIKYMQNFSINVPANIYLVVDYYAIDNYEFSSTASTSYKTFDTATLVSFATNGTYIDEGKYTIRYCSNYLNEETRKCGAEATFIIDRTAPIVKYSLVSGPTGEIITSISKDNPLKISTTMDITSILDIDPYAYTMIEGKKYYLTCNSLINSSSCLENIDEYIKRTFEHDSEKPNNIYEIHVYDRTGNKIDAYLQIGKAKPTVSVIDNESESFTLVIDFYDKNEIDSLVIAYTKSEACDKCADTTTISEAIMNYIEILTAINEAELKKAEADDEYIPEITYSISLPFILTKTNLDNTTTGGLSIPVYEMDEENNYVLKEGENQIFNISKGLYKITLGDTFNNISETYGGIGLEKAESDIYINADESHIESIETITSKLPKLEVGTNTGNVFLARVPDTYAYEDMIPSELRNGFDGGMFFTNQFIYIKLKINAFSVIQLSRATYLNNVGNYRNNETTNLSCMFVLYGVNVSVGNLPECTKQLKATTSGYASTDTNPTINDAAEELATEGIYVVGREGDYLYVAFTQDGTYRVHSEILVEVQIEGESYDYVALPVEHSFTIDTVSPKIDFELTCDEDRECNGIKAQDQYTNTGENPDFVTLTNIGSYNMRLLLTNEMLFYKDASGQNQGSINRLLVFKINDGDVYNAFSYSKEYSFGGNYIEFSDSGDYTIVFLDAVGNETVYKFTIDKTAPSVVEIKDINDKPLGEYQQYVNIKLTIQERSFLTDRDDNMLTIIYSINEKTVSIGIARDNTNENKCIISGDVDDPIVCLVNEDGVTVSFVITFNEEERLTGLQTLDLTIRDYFGNEVNLKQDFEFDNQNPYIYYDSSYTPITNFGAGVSTDDMDKMLSTPADSSLGIFDCSDSETLISGKVICKDTPEKAGMDNKIVIESFEAMRVAYNNYIRNINGTYSIVDNGTYVEPNVNLYKRVYTMFGSANDLQAAKDGETNIYTKGKYIRVYNNEYINPNISYYYMSGSTYVEVSIQDMYTNTATYNTYTDEMACGANHQCLLYLKYMNSGHFTSEDQYFTYSSSDYTLVEDKSAIDNTQYTSYYYETNNYASDSGKYLPALTLKNSCISVNNGNCVMVSDNRVKLNSFDGNSITYYNFVYKSEEETSSLVRKITLQDNTEKDAVLDNRIWQIAKNSANEEVRFAFGLASELGRPIIFRAKDGAGNTASNYLETVIRVTDEIGPEITNGYSIKYEKDESGGTTLNNYVQVTKYYKVVNKEGLSCNNDNKYYTYNGEGYTEVACSDDTIDDRYYVGVTVYEKVEDGLTKEDGTTYYKAETVDLEGNYITKENIVIEFSEPIYKVECTYYDSNLNQIRDCSFHNTEFDYREDKKSFSLVYEKEGEYYVNYNITVYDFSGNSLKINHLFIDREKPTIDFNEGVEEDEYIEAKYGDSSSPSDGYDSDYITGGFKNETTSIDNINNKINEIGVSSLVDNTFRYEIKYYKFNHNITFGNYTLNNGVFTIVSDGSTKDSNTKYYILIKKPTDYILKGNSGTCIGDYCYIIDDSNYYPSLLTNASYWEEQEVIVNDKVGVYKIEYRVIDRSGNVSDTIYKTVYITDTTAPILKVNDEIKSKEEIYGAHNKITISVDNEYEAVYYRYTCSDGSVTCELPTEIFSGSNSNLTLSVENITNNFSVTNDKNAGVYKIYFHDKGSYIKSSINIDGTVDDIMTLKYNYVEYSYIIDLTKPAFYINALVDDNGKLYYEVSTSEEAQFYCIKTGGDEVYSLCENLLTGNPTLETGGDSIIYSIKNGKDETIYEIKYTKVPEAETKYFYNTYYKLDVDGNLVAYEPGAKYEEDNVYLVTSIILRFREDGEYQIKAVDKAGNETGRITGSGTQENSSSFTIDNTAPTYNKEQISATGANYWFSVPSGVINSGNMNYITSITQDLTGNSYNILGSGLNNDFFYAFATRAEAKMFLTTIYAKHIDAQEDNNCNNGQGFSYSYYNPAGQGSITTTCFVGTDNKTNKDMANEEMATNLFDAIIFPTFSGNLLFGDSAIMQKACDSSVSENCLTNEDMYKFIYLKIEGTTKTVVETCTESDEVKCIKVNVKITNVNDKKITLEIKGENTADTSKITAYNGASSTEYTSSSTIDLNTGQYYIFEEIDTGVEYINYKTEGGSSNISHYNSTYYAVYVDNADPIAIYSKENETINSTNLINTDGFGNVKTNVEQYSLIIKNNGESENDFMKKYEIHKNENEVYSYLRLVINGVYHNINDYIVLDSDSGSYYFEIPLAEEAFTIIEIYDRAGNKTYIEVSRSQTAPSIDITYSGEGKDQTVTLILEDSELTKIKTEEIVIKYSNDGSNYLEDQTGDIKEALLCVAGSNGCLNTGPIDGKNSYTAVIDSSKKLFGFFYISLKDDHGNTNELKFIYNPVDLSANYNGSYKYITPNMDEEYRMTANDSLKVSWNNEDNYILLYKQNESGFEIVCNTKEMNNSNISLCGENENNKVEPQFVEGTYTNSILTYVDEGKYKVEIINRESERISAMCINSEDNSLKEECQNIKAYVDNVIAYQTKKQEVSSIYETITYYLFDIDKTLPNYDISDFVVRLPSGSVGFENNNEYTNAEITIKWREPLIKLEFECEYIDDENTPDIDESELPCNGNNTGFSKDNKEYTFKIQDKKSTRYSFWFEDYAGNTTIANKISFTIMVVLPEIEVHELDDNGVIIQDSIVTPGKKIKNNAKLICYFESVTSNCDIYNIKVYKFTGSGYQEIVLRDPTVVSESYETRYKYVVSIKGVDGYIYENLATELEFTIDKIAPNITVEGNQEELYGFYKGEVRILIDSNGEGTIYNQCVVTGVDEYGDNTYSCSVTPVVESFTSNYTLSETGSYMIIARDEVGNITTGREIKYITIDNEKPKIKVTVSNEYVTYGLSEKGYTNADKVLVESVDNNEGNYFMYRKMKADGTYDEWITQTSSSLEIIDEGYYEVKPVDAVGNEGLERHFIIYRQAPKYYIYVNNKLNVINDIITEDTFITWDEPKNELVAPIIKVTLNGKPYQKRTVLNETGEYVFNFTDLAGNSITHKLTINKSDSICLDNVKLVPNKQYLFPVDNIALNGGEGYEFKKDDVIVFATPTNYYGSNPECAQGVLCYKSLDKSAYILIDDGTAKYINQNKNVIITISDEHKNQINQAGGFVYAIIVNKNVAKEQLGFEIGENFFTKDPLGWSLIFISSAGLIFIGLKVVVFKKKVKVLK